MPIADLPAVIRPAWRQGRALRGLMLVVPSLAMAAGAAGPASMEALSAAVRQELLARAVTEPSRAQASLIENGHWRVFQGRRGAKPGEYCTAVFWKQDRMIAVAGPGGGETGASLSFIELAPEAGFPRPADARQSQTIKVLLTQGRDTVAVSATNSTIAGLGGEIRIAVPSIEAAMAGMEERLAFRLEHAGRQVFKLDWHSGQAARQLLRRCLAGEKVDGKEVP